MARASLIAAAGAALLVALPEGSATSLLAAAPSGSCAEAVIETVDARLDHLTTVVGLMEQGVDPRSFPAAPSDFRLTACHG